MPRPVATKWIRNPSDELAISQGCWFDVPAGSYVCEFIEEFCRQSKDRWAGEPIKLLDWQRDLLMRLFGWKLPNGLRRFKRCYVEVAKKNGKSTLVSALVLYLVLADGTSAPEIYLNACDKKQAAIIFEEAARMVDASPDLTTRLEIKRSDKRIVDPIGYGAIITNSADAPNKDGLNPSTVIFDELHRQPNYDLWDIFEYAGVARQQRLTISITTAGEDESGIWFEQREYSEKLNRGEIPDITHLGVIYRADPEDDIEDPATWAKANPSLGAVLSVDDFRKELAEVKETPRKLAGFLRLRLNVISNAETVFILPADWAACSSPRVEVANLRGIACYAGGDLSKTTDLTALVALWGEASAGFDLAAWFWMPADNVKFLARRDRQPYDLWIREGWITTTPGAVVDYAFIRNQLIDLAGAQDLRKALFDPYNATQLVIELREQDGLSVDFLRQGFLSLSPPTKELERLVKSRRLRHGDNPVMRWMLGNAIAETDAAGNVKLNKKKSRQKIDGASALVNALAAAISDDGQAGPSIYESRGVRSL